MRPPHDLSDRLRRILMVSEAVRLVQPGHALDSRALELTKHKYRRLTVRYHKALRKVISQCLKARYVVDVLGRKTQEGVEFVVIKCGLNPLIPLTELGAVKR